MRFPLIAVLLIKQTTVGFPCLLPQPSQKHKTNQPNSAVNFAFDIFLFFKENKCAASRLLAQTEEAESYF